jgi:hypothetical protein
MGKDYWAMVVPWWDQIAEDWESEQGYLSNISRVSRPALLLGTAHFCCSEICNGGFVQLFNNSTGMIVPEAIEGFRAIGMPETAAVIEEAVCVFGSSYPRDRDGRQRAFAAVGNRIAAFDALNDRFYQVVETENGGFEEAASRYSERLRDSG